MTEPYWSDGQVMLYLGDCREVLPGLPLASVLVTDPPYASAGHRYHLGRYDAEQDAAMAYDAAALAAWGEYAHLNFPEETA